jgi:hypothetical protein
VEIASAAILGGVVFATTTSDQFCDSLPGGVDRPESGFGVSVQPRLAGLWTI